MVAGGFADIIHYPVNALTELMISLDTSAGNDKAAAQSARHAVYGSYGPAEQSCIHRISFIPPMTRRFLRGRIIAGLPYFLVEVVFPEGSEDVIGFLQQSNLSWNNLAEYTLWPVGTEERVTVEAYLPGFPVPGRCGTSSLKRYRSGSTVFSFI